MRGDPKVWTPVRYIRHDQKCDFCWERIRAGKPGSTTGTRGTKAFFNAALDIFECIDCRAEATRVELYLMDERARKAAA